MFNTPWLLSMIKFFFVIVFIAAPFAFANESTPHNWGFQGKYLLSVSDADMVASAYVDGILGPKEGTDKLSIISLKGLPNDYVNIEVPASNSVAGPPAAVAVSPNGRFAYVIETFSPRPIEGEEHTFTDLKLGNTLTVYDLKNPEKPRLASQQRIGLRPDSINVSADGNWLAISYYPVDELQSRKPLGIYRVNKGKVIDYFFPSINGWEAGERLIYAEWHPNKNRLALVNNTSAVISFHDVNFEEKQLTQWGNSVSVGKSPFIGRFSQDGNHFLTNNLYWGEDVEGTWNEAPPGTIVNIRLNANDNDRSPRHALNSQVMVGPSPEGFAVSPDGKWVVALNMERSWLPYNDPRQNWFSSLSLIKRDEKSGTMNMMHTSGYDGILPEAAVFDSSGKYLAVTTFDFYDQSMKGGAIDYFRIGDDPLNPAKKILVKTRWYTPVTRGPHSLVLVK